MTGLVVPILFLCTVALGGAACKYPYPTCDSLGGYVYTPAAVAVCHEDVGKCQVHAPVRVCILPGHAVAEKVTPQ